VDPNFELSTNPRLQPSGAGAILDWKESQLVGSPSTRELVAARQKSRFCPAIIGTNREIAPSRLVAMAMMATMWVW
jgi:hypothetical protein